MTDEELLMRNHEILEEKSHNQKQWHWLSFCDPDLPKKQQFLGVAIVYAQGPVTASMRAHRLGIDPGGEVLCVEIDPNNIPPAEYHNRLLLPDEAKALCATIDGTTEKKAKCKKR